MIQSERKVWIVQPLVVTPPLSGDFACYPIFTANGALGLDLEFVRPLPE